jgi:NADH:ubiquinone oxidoreductase subunit 2 (subunit N)
VESFTRNKPLKRIIKYLVNLSCLGFLIAGIGVSYATIVRVPNLQRIFDIIWNQAGNVALISIVFVLIATYLNFVFERKIEKRKTSREFIILSLIHIIILTLAFAYFSWNFYSDYIAHPEYF